MNRHLPRAGTRWVFNAVILFLCLLQSALAQVPPYGLEGQPHTLGTLYYPGTHVLKSVPVRLYGNQDVYATAYLPFIQSEYSAGKPIELFGTNYTTGVAMCSPKDPSLGLYAPVQVASWDHAKQKWGAITSFAPLGVDYQSFNGPFDVYINLNTNTVIPFDPILPMLKVDEISSTILKHAQDFTTFSHSYLKDKNDVGWNGFDKDGNVPIVCVVDGQSVANIYNHEQSNISFGVSTDNLIKSVIGHEITHGIIDRFLGYDQNLASQSRKELNEALGNIVGFSFSHSANNFNIASNDWTFFWESEQLIGTYYWNPKITEFPNAYLGQYYQTNPNAPDYTLHKNSTVLEFFFYLLNEGKTGYVDDKTEKGAYTVQPLIPGNKQETFKLALRIIFNAFANGLSNGAEYPDLAVATLEAAASLGYTTGTNVHSQLINAWHAVGVEMPAYNKNCAATATALSMFNGVVQLNVRESTLTPNPSSGKVRALTDCSGNDITSTVNVNGSYITDWDEDQTYSDANNIFESKIAVSIHAFSRISKGWFKDRFSHGGYNLNYVLESQTPVVKSIFQGNQATLYAAYQETEALRDQISKRYFGVVSHYLKEADNLGQAQSPDHTLIFHGLSNIFALEIKRDYELNKGSNDALNLWTLNEEAAEANLFNDFSNPKFSEQPALYQGANWNPSNLERSAGFLNLFYYLLAHGTADELGQDFGYSNIELPGKTYFVNKQDKKLILEVLWQAYRSTALNAGIEEFRQATMTTLHQLDPVKYHAKSKEHIAFYDAWAAVLGLPDYASTLKHFPEDYAIVYPWTAKVGVEAEYPIYESHRLFEVSKSSTFNENEYPVHRFVSGSAPDLESGMTYGYINLEPGEQYWVRSHLAEGPDARAFCEGTDDPAFCESLLGKKKWTLPYPFTTQIVQAPFRLSPLKGQEVAAWATPFKWLGIKGSLGYTIHVTDPELTAAEHDVHIEMPYDEDKIGEPLETTVALAKDRPYSYKMAARQRLGSDQAVHVLPGGMLQLLTEAEKEQFPDVYGKWNDEVAFRTGIPRIKLHSPADGAHLPLFGKDTTLRAKKEYPQLADYYQFSMQEPFYTAKAAETDSSFAHYGIIVQGLQGLVDKKVYEWTFIQRKKATLPFIPEEEEGASPGWFKFIVDKDLVPKPELENIDCVEKGATVVFHWKEVPGAQSYKVTIMNAATQAVVSTFQTGYTGATVNGASDYPNKYAYKVAAGVMGGEGEWIFGPEAVGDYSVHPPNPTNLIPNGNNNVTLGENQSVQLTWQMPAGLEAVDVRAEIKGESNLGEERVLGNTFNLGGLPFGKDIIWSLQAVSNSGCLGEEVLASFKTEEAPDEFDFGFELRVDNNDPKITGGFYHYTIKVVRPDGNIDFTGTGTADADTWQQVGFVPELGQVINGNELNGQLTDQQGDYLMELEIIDMAQCQNCADAHAKPEIKVRGMEYIRKKGESNWKLNKSVQPQPSDPVFPSRTIGAKKVIKLHYSLPN
jgi:hypothetical protein